MTVLSEKRRDAAREATKKSRYTPKDLRLKKNRAWRRKLTKFEEKKLTLRAQKKAANNKLRKYSLAA